MFSRISIHAPRTGSDPCFRASAPKPAISIHAPRTGSDQRYERGSVSPSGISIHAPRTGSDGFWHGFYCSLQHFNPRSPHGERHLAVKVLTEIFLFQSTLPARGATFALCKDLQLAIFQSTLPARGATWLSASAHSGEWHFNPRSPHGERLDFAVLIPLIVLFQSTLPARGATWHFAAFCGTMRISIHAPRTGSDQADGRAG